MHFGNIMTSDQHISEPDATASSKSLAQMVAKDAATAVGTLLSMGVFSLQMSMSGTKKHGVGVCG